MSKNPLKIDTFVSKIAGILLDIYLTSISLKP